MGKKEKIKSFFSGTLGYFIGITVLLIIFNINAISSWAFPKPELEVGTVSEETIKSPRTIYYKSNIKTEEAQERITDGVEKVYTFDSTAKVQQESKVEEVFRRIDADRSQGKIEETTGLSDEVSGAIASLDKDSWNKIKNSTKKLLSDVHNSEEIRDDEDLAQEVFSKYLGKDLPENDKFIINSIASDFIISNYHYSQDETEKSIELAKEEVEPVSLLIVKDEVLITSGDLIDNLDLEKLEAVGLQKTNLWDVKNMGSLIVSLIFLLVTFMYFRYFYKSRNDIRVSALKAFYIFVTLFSVLVLSYEIILPLRPIIAYLFPVAAPVILISILVGFETAFFAAVIFSVFMGLMLSSSVELTVLYLFTSFVGIYKSKEIKRISDIFQIGIWLLFFNFIISLSFHLIASSFSAKTVSVLLGAASIYALGSVVIVIGTLMFWGNIFKVTTLLDLLELENPHQKLLKELSLNAPGTYHHSVLVSNICQKAAKDIKINVLLCGVSALYHDIGKVNSPEYFIENQGRKNIHENIKDPEKSAQAIKEHVSHGVEMARKYKLPKEIVHAIESHHGTSEVFYFLEKAKKKGSKVNLEKFKYPGPLPKTKEAAVVMLADAIEAKSRAEAKGISGKKIISIVEGIVMEKTERGQLKNSPLSLREIEILKKSFVDILSTMYHKRIKYEK